MQNKYVKYFLLILLIVLFIILLLNIFSWFNPNQFQTRQKCQTRQIKIISPVGGQTWKTGEIRKIQWTCTNLPATDMLGIFIVNVANNKLLPIDNKRASDTSDSWYVNLPFFFVTPDNNQYKIQISRLGNILATSDSFTINPAPITTVNVPTLKIISPIGGEQWQIGTTQTIKWTSTGLPNTDKILLKLVDSSYKNHYFIITDAAPNSGSFSWVIPNSILPSDKFWIQIADMSTMGIGARASNNFSIVLRTTTSK